VLSWLLPVGSTSARPSYRGWPKAAGTLPLLLSPEAYALVSTACW
jgi:hypothetical protein